jgi:nitroimidazol reductase NimA-like FMN-containing flavoprotein (pyridoxamine 5'-phosphate oxidase superfamily)
MATMAMSKEETEAFLSIPRLARLATISNGRPHIVSVCYYYDGTIIIISATKGKKIKNIKNRHALKNRHTLSP